MKVFFFFFFFFFCFFFFFSSKKGSMKAPTGTIRGPAEIRQKQELDWTKVMFSQRVGTLEFYVGARLMGSPSLARLMWFPAARDGVLRLVFEGETELFICPLEANVSDWEKKIRDWAAYLQQINVDELAIPPSQRRREPSGTVRGLSLSGELKKKEDAKKALEPSSKKKEEVKKAVDPKKTKKEEPKKVDSPSLTKKEEPKKDESKARESANKTLNRRTNAPSVVDSEVESGGRILSTIRKAPLLQGLRKGSSRSSVDESSNQQRRSARVSVPEIDFEISEPRGSDFCSSGWKLSSGKWKACWYRLTGSKLLCFETSSSKLPISFADVKMLIDLRMEEDTKRRFVVSFSSGGATRKLMVDSKLVAEQWLSRLREESAEDSVPVEQRRGTFELRQHSGTTLEAPMVGDVVDMQTAQMCFSALQAFDGEDEVVPGTETNELASLLDDMLEMDDQYEKAFLVLV
jgi:hypothetical protein